MVVHVEGEAFFPHAAFRTPEERLAEAVNLTEALQVDIVRNISITLTKLNSKTLIGGGWVEKIAEIVKEKKIDVVMINAPLLPRQQRNLEIAFNVKVIDRTGLILEIFAQRARTKAGRLQVELAQLKYQQSRLVRTWTHLERQRGGLGKTGGPGERQIELDRRMLRDRMGTIKRQLKDVEKERGLQRRARLKNRTPVVALVGYTNAGKSTLFNALVSEKTLAQDMLFATLDPLMRQMELPSKRIAILADTVGFVSDLPHELVEAFHATLEEVAMADVLIHVHDASSSDAIAQAQDVMQVLEDIGAHDSRIIDVANKADLVKGKIIGDALGISVSAVTGENVEKVLQAIDSTLGESWKEVLLKVSVSNGRKVAWLHAHGEILSQEIKGETWHIRVKLMPEDLNLFKKMT